MNYVTLTGRITRELVLRESKNKNAYVFFTIAVNNFKNQVDFIPCVAWNEVAKNMCNYLIKGSLILVAGRVQTRKAENTPGGQVMEINATTVEFLDNKTKNTQLHHQEPAETNYNEKQDNQTDIAFVNNENCDKNLSDDEAIDW